jgi:hypothetical protein
VVFAFFSAAIKDITFFWEVMLVYSHQRMVAFICVAFMPHWFFAIYANRFCAKLFRFRTTFKEIIFIPYLFCPFA